MNKKITHIFARYILDSRANSTVEVEVTLDDGNWGRAAVPSGASTGSLEAHELRDESKDFNGKGVNKAVDNINSLIADTLIGSDAGDQSKIDQALLELDGTKNKSKLGANAILAVSMANMVANAKSSKKYVYELIPNIYGAPSLPVPFMNILNGGAHADNSVDIQEFMIVPHGFTRFDDGLKAGVEVYHTLKKRLKDKGLATNVGDEGGFAPMISKNEEALKLISEAIKRAGFINGKDVSICLDVAANELFKNNKYAIDSKKYISYKNTILFYSKIIKRYKIKSIEDPFAENDWKSWSDLLKKEKKIQIVGDDLYVTNLQRLKKGFLYQSSNSILIKLNQIGTVSETLDVIKFAQNIGYTTIISHRSGDSEDTFISDLAVGTNSNQIKTGSLCRSERVAKFNQLLRIEANLIKSNNMAKLK